MCWRGTAKGTEGNRRTHGSQMSPLCYEHQCTSNKRSRSSFQSFRSYLLVIIYLGFPAMSSFFHPDLLLAAITGDLTYGCPLSTSFLNYHVANVTLASKFSSEKSIALAQTLFCYACVVYWQNTGQTATLNTANKSPRGKSCLAWKTAVTAGLVERLVILYFGLTRLMARMYIFICHTFLAHEYAKGVTVSRAEPADAEVCDAKKRTLVWKRTALTLALTHGA